MVVDATGTPKYDGNFQHCIERVRYEANLYKKHKIVGSTIIYPIYGL